MSSRKLSAISCGKFDGKTAIITGGAGFIGSRIVRSLVSEGCCAAICDTDIKQAGQVAEQVDPDGKNVITIPTDVCKSDDVRQAVAKTIDTFGKVDFLVCVAGGSTRDRKRYFCDQKEEIYVENININLFGALYFAQAVTKHMAQQQSGKIVFITSVLGIQGWRNCAEYSAAKGGLITFSKALAMEMGEFGVNVNCVSPGLVERGSADVSSHNYLGRNCTGEDIANAVSFLLSEEAGFVTGANLVVDGGWGLGVQSGIKPGRMKSNYQQT